MLNDKRIKACISRHDNGAYSRMQFLAAMSHSMGAHTEALCLTADSSSSDEDERYEASPATTSESSESPATAAAMLMFALKGKYQKNSDQQSPIIACSFYSDGSNALLYEPMVNFSANLYCFAADEIELFGRPIPAISRISPRVGLFF